MRSLVTVSVFSLILAACASPDNALDSPDDTSTTAVVEDTTSTTVAATTTSEAPQVASITPNAGELRAMVAVDADGQVPGGTLIGCHGGRSFPASALDEIPLLADSDLPEIEAAIQPFLESGEGAHWPQDDWRVLHRTDDRVLLVHSDDTTAEPRLAFMEIEKEEGEWDWAGSGIGGGCALEVKVPGEMNAVDWRLDPDAEPLTPESTVIQVLVTERACAGGQEVGDRLLGPEVIVTDTEVLVAFAAQAQPGAHECPENPETAVTIELSGPLGARDVANGLDLGLALEDVLSN